MVLFRFELSYAYSFFVSQQVGLCLCATESERENIDYVINMHINYVVVDHDAVVKMRMVDVVMMCCTE